MAVRKTKKGAALKKWFKEDWRDVKTGKKCGRSGNAKGRASYNKGRTPTGKKRNLKAPSKTVGNPRRASFCARMQGMKKKLTSSKTARDPNSRINKSLRAWNCSGKSKVAKASAKRRKRLKG